jgi:hypothetical protein
LFYDITEYRKTEDKVRRLSLVVEEGPTAVIIVDNEGNIEYVNPKFSSMTQYASKEVLGKNPRILKSGEHSEEFYKNLWDTIKSGKEWHGQLHNKKKSGELYWESASISPLRDSKGEITNFIAIKEDITELKNVENDLKIAGEKLEKEAADLARANEELKKIDQMKSEFTSMVSHELRTPLAAIKEGIAIVLDGTAGNINEKQKEFLELGKRNVDRLSRLINNILDFQKLESAKVLLNIVDNDINEAVLEVEATMKPLAKEKELVLVSETEKGLPKIKFDRDKIIQVLTNLANNAIKFTQKGTITIKTERAKEVVKISVIDTGSGIKEEDLSKLFQPFVQLEKGPDKTSGGTGLGLAICREIINRHKGKIWAESKPGKGSVFVFVLPVVERRS